jgi:hypothetical protein
MYFHITFVDDSMIICYGDIDTKEKEIEKMWMIKYWNVHHIMSLLKEMFNLLKLII